MWSPSGRKRARIHSGWHEAAAAMNHRCGIPTLSACVSERGPGHRTPPGKTIPREGPSAPGSGTRLSGRQLDMGRPVGTVRSPWNGIDTCASITGAGGQGLGVPRPHLRAAAMSASSTSKTGIPGSCQARAEARRTSGWRSCRTGPAGHHEELRGRYRQGTLSMNDRADSPMTGGWNAQARSHRAELCPRLV